MVEVLHNYRRAIEVDQMSPTPIIHPLSQDRLELDNVTNAVTLNSFLLRCCRTKETHHKTSHCTANRVPTTTVRTRLHIANEHRC